MNSILINVSKAKLIKDRRKTDAFMDRRDGEERRKVYDADYFASGGFERRRGEDRRQSGERRKGYIRVSEWSSVSGENGRDNGRR